MIFFAIFITTILIKIRIDFEPLCVVKIDYDPILKIESIQNALSLNVPNNSWLVCPTTSEDKLKSTVSKKTMFSENGLLSKQNRNTKCTKEITPAVLESIADDRNLEIGYEVSYPSNIEYEIDNRQLNTHYRRKKIHLPFISVISIKLRPQKETKMVIYEIINAKNTHSKIEEITCTFDTKKNDNFVNEDDFAEKLNFKNPDESAINFFDDPSDYYTLIFLAPKQHLISKGKQYAACAIENLSSVRNVVEDAWLKTNNFIMETARKLGKLQIVAGASGTLQMKKATGGYKPIIMELHGHEIGLPEIVWRIVKYTIYSERNDIEIEFGIVIITSNFSFENDEKICECICRKNDWDSVLDYSTFCCPVDEVVLKILGINDEILPIYNELKISKVKQIEEKYELFDSLLSF